MMSGYPLCEFCNKPMHEITSPKQRFHNKHENKACYNERMRGYWRPASNKYYKTWKIIIKVRKGKGTGSLGAHRCENVSEEIIKIRREKRRLGLVKDYQTPITYIKTFEAIP